MKRLFVIGAAALIMIPLAAMYVEGGTPPAALAMASTFLRTKRPAPAPAPAPEADLMPAPAGRPVAKPVTPVKPAPAPAPAPTPAPAAEPSDWALAPALEGAVRKAMAGFAGEYSVVVQDMKTGQRFAIDPERMYHPASTIKMPVTLYALSQYRAGKLSWQQGITYTEADYESPGGGAFETAPFGGVYPVENLVGRALRYSNNVAVNMLGRYLGWNNIRAFTRTVGGELYRQDDGTPQVTALSELGWWLYLDKLSQEDAKAADLLLQPLREVEYNGRIAAGLPKGVRFLHKFGSYDGNYHDGGIVYGKRPYALVVLTDGASVDQADAAIARVSAGVYGVMSGK